VAARGREHLEERQRELGWFSLEKGRLRGDLRNADSPPLPLPSPLLSPGRKPRTSAAMSTTSRGCATAPPARWPTASMRPSGRRKVRARQPQGAGGTPSPPALGDGLSLAPLLRRSVLPVHEDDRAGSVSPPALGAGELRRADRWPSGGTAPRSRSVPASLLGHSSTLSPGPGPAQQELREGTGRDRREPHLLATVHPAQVQAALHQDHAVPHPHPEADAQATVSNAPARGPGSAHQATACPLSRCHGPGPSAPSCLPRALAGS